MPWPLVAIVSWIAAAVACYHWGHWSVVAQQALEREARTAFRAAKMSVELEDAREVMRAMMRSSTSQDEASKAVEEYVKRQAMSATPQCDPRFGHWFDPGQTRCACGETELSFVDAERSRRMVQ